MTDERSTETNAALFILGLICWFPTVLLGGYTLAKLWQWFLVPVFPAAPVLSLGHAVGLNLLLGYITIHIDTHKNDQPSYSVFEMQLMAAILCAMALLFGRIYLAIFF